VAGVAAFVEGPVKFRRVFMLVDTEAVKYALDTVCAHEPRLLCRRVHPYGNHGFVNLGTLGTRFGGIAADADLSEDTWHAAKQAGSARCRRTPPCWRGCCCPGT
jgi:hypothetical protein